MQSAGSNCVLATGGYDHTIRLWRVDTGSCYQTLQHPDSQVNCMQVTPDKACVAVGGHGQIRFFDVKSASKSPVSVYDGHRGNVTEVGFSTDGSWMYSGGDDQTVKIWDIRTSPEASREFKHQSPVTCVALHPNQGELISGDQEGRIVRWDLRANQCYEHLIPEPDTAIRSVCISSDARLMAAVNNSGNCYIWELEGSDLRALKKLTVHERSYVLKCKFSPDVRTLATTSSDQTIRVWDVESDFALMHTMAEHQMWVWDCAFSADSAYLVSVSSDNTGKIWNVDSGQLAMDLKGHQRAVTSVALNDS